MKTYLNGPTDYAETIKLRYRVGGMNLPEKRKRYTSSREEEDAQMCPCGKAIENTVELTQWENEKCTRNGMR